MSDDFTQLVDLASERIGGSVVAANDEFFAPKENLLKRAKPVFMEDKYTDRGKWMDGWETRRRRTPGHDWCIVELGAPGILRGVIVDTSFFRGNFPEACSIESCAIDGSPDADNLLAPEVHWNEVLSRSSLNGNSQNSFAIDYPYRCTHLRLHIYPDGGVARLRAFGEVLPDWQKILGQQKVVDLAAIEHGGQIVDCSDKFFSAPQNLLMPDKSSHMGDGWETRRRRGPGYDWVIIKMGIAGKIEEIEVDTTHFKGNFPESCSLEVTHVSADGDLSSASWKELLARTALEADSVRAFKVPAGGQATHVRFNMYPDGGVARLRIRGTPTVEGKRSAGLRWLNSLPEGAAINLLKNCCGSAKWSEQMLRQRPFSSFEKILQEAARACEQLSEKDWLEAFSSHPKIGEQKAVADKQAERWSQQEQSAASGAPAKIVLALSEANQVYYSRFGYIFIVSATGKTAEQMLALLQERTKNNPKAELEIAAHEQRKITQLRLEKMLSL